MHATAIRAGLSRIRRFVRDGRGIGGPGAGGALAVVLLVSTIGAGMAVDAGVGERSDPGQQADVLAEGVASGLDNTNRDAISQRGPPAQAGPRTQAQARRAAPPAKAWTDTPPGLQNALAKDVGGFLAQVRARTGQQGELEQVRPAGDGVVAGALVKQHGTDRHTITQQTTETYEVETKKLDHYEEYVSGYEEVFAGWEKEKVGTRNVTVGYRWEIEYKKISYEVPVYETRTAVRWVEETYTTTHTETYYEKVYHCYDRNGHMNAPGDPTAGKQCRWDTVAKTRTVTEEHTRMVKETYTTEYIDHYKTKYKWEKKPVKKPITETKPVYEKKATYTQKPIYDTRPVYRTVTEEKTRTKTVEQTVTAGPFTHDDASDWLVATDVTDLRDSSLRVEKTALAESKSSALTLEATGKTTGETWTLRVWQSSGNIVVETSTGIRKQVSDEAVEINFEAGTIDGDSVGVHVGAGLRDDENFALGVRNGDNARGTYTFVLAGEPRVNGQSSNPASDAAGVTVVEDLVYAATFDVTVETGDGTYSERITVEPVTPTDAVPMPADRTASTGAGAGADAGAGTDTGTGASCTNGTLSCA